ncbi:hypothetical protein [Halovivax sp.]|uniref:hypothetical protein n=1 Tax=Halovivax sp. TaxID=1935978 RepID=UPI0025C42F44|nr:hypothetical protein [Halovivax sp.]
MRFDVRADHRTPLPAATDPASLFVDPPTDHCGHDRTVANLAVDEAANWSVGFAERNTS